MKSVGTRRIWNSL